MAKVNHRLIAYILIPIVISLGFLRDYLFVNINWVYLHHTIQRRNQARREFDFLLEWTPSEINQLKVVLTLLFYALFMGLTVWVIHGLFGKRTFNLITIGIFAGIFALSGILYLIGIATPYYSRFYAVVITMMQTAQSFTPMLLLAVVFKFFPKSENE